AERPLRVGLNSLNFLTEISSRHETEPTFLGPTLPQPGPFGEPLGQAARLAASIPASPAAIGSSTGATGASGWAGRLLTLETVMDRAQKAEAVEDLKGVFAKAGVVVVGHYAGLSVADMTVLRRRLRDVGGELKVVKNRLAKIALKDAPQSAGAHLFTGPTAIAFSADPGSATKVPVAYAKEKEKFVLLGALIGAQL